MFPFSHRAAVAAFSLVLACARVHPAGPSGSGEPYGFAEPHGAGEPYGLDLRGQPIHQLGGPGVHLVVLIFGASDCPISNRYVPEVARLNEEFAAQGVRVWWVFPNPEDTAPIVTKHDAEFSIAEPVVLDTRQTLVRLARVTVTPEAAVFGVDGGVLHELYRGRIDDRYLSIGTERPQPGRHDLEAAIAAALAGKPVPQAGGPPVGCAVVPREQ
jgi:hypothetical protein